MYRPLLPLTSPFTVAQRADFVAGHKAEVRLGTLSASAEGDFCTFGHLRLRPKPKLSPSIGLCITAFVLFVRLSVVVGAECMIFDNFVIIILYYYFRCMKLRTGNSDVPMTSPEAVNSMILIYISMPV